MREHTHMYIHIYIHIIFRAGTDVTVARTLGALDPIDVNRIVRVIRYRYIMVVQHLSDRLVEAALCRGDLQQDPLGFKADLEVLQFLKTCFVRALVAMVTATQHLSKANFRFVPLQDFSRPWTDADLYAKYGLTEEEIAFIESMIKPME